MKSSIVIGNRAVGHESPPYVIAELSANHNGNIESAFAIMEAAKHAGADAVKLQTYTADTMTINHNGPDFRLTEGLWAGHNLYELYEWAHTPWEWHEALFAKGKELDIAVFSTPFDISSVDFLEKFDPPAYKIASFELIDLPLIEYVASTGKPIIMSTGMADQYEIMDAVTAATRAGCSQLCLLQCTSGYPAPASEANLRKIIKYDQCYDVVPGLSDHTVGTAVSVAAVALGACVIEKHLTLRRSDGGPDAEFSMEPEEFALLVRDTHMAWEALGDVQQQLKLSEKPQRHLRRSLYVVEDIRAGETFTKDNVRAIRPGYGIPPRYINEVIGSRATSDIARGTALKMEHFKIV